MHREESGPLRFPPQCPASHALPWPCYTLLCLPWLYPYPGTDGAAGTHGCTAVIDGGDGHRAGTQAGSARVHGVVPAVPGPHDGAWSLCKHQALGTQSKGSTLSMELGREQRVGETGVTWERGWGRRLSWPSLSWRKGSAFQLWQQVLGGTMRNEAVHEIQGFAWEPRDSPSGKALQRETWEQGPPHYAPPWPLLALLSKLQWVLLKCVHYLYLAFTLCLFPLNALASCEKRNKGERRGKWDWRILYLLDFLHQSTTC